MNLLLVTTGGGFELDDAVKYLVTAIGESNPLPANQAGVAASKRRWLSGTAARSAACGAPADMAKLISGHTYRLKITLTGWPVCAWTSTSPIWKP